MADVRRLGEDHETEALVVDLIERVELESDRAARLEREVETLRAQRDVLQTELDHATDVVAELARQLIEVESRLVEQPLSLAAHLRRRAAG